MTSVGKIGKFATLGAFCIWAPTSTVNASAQADQTAQQEMVGEPGTFLVHAGQNQIAAELVVKRQERPDTAIILIGGSGAVTRDDVRPAVPLFLGDDTAVVLYDRRGNGQSTGDYERANTRNSHWQIPLLGSDVVHIAAHLKTMGFAHVGVAGSSMGSWIAASAAAQSEDVDFLIGMVGGAVSVATSDAFDSATDNGLSIPDALMLARKGHDTVSYDPAQDLASLEAEGFWVFAENDRSNPSALDIERLDALISNGKRFQYVIVKGADHNLSNTQTGAFDGSWIGAMQEFINNARD